MEKKKFIRYLELETKDGPLYLYEQYNSDPDVPFNSEIPITKEFFTGEEGVRGYNTLLFLDGKCEFEIEHRDLNGDLRDSFVNRLHPYEFLERVLPYLETEESLKQKRLEVLNILQFNANIIAHRITKKTPPKVSEQTKDELSEKILRKYMK